MLLQLINFADLKKNNLYDINFQSNNVFCKICIC
jgi:hypothetical protein